MCGIICAIHYGEKAKDPVNHHVMNQYEEQHSRGTEGFGLIKIESNKKPVTILRATEPIKALVDVYMNPMMAAIFHHRSPTATKNSLGQTHPIMVEDEKLEFSYAVVHNGCIQNADEMYKKHKELNFLYTTYYQTHYPYKSNYTRSETAVGKFNDSESLAIELARFLEGKIDKIEAHGSAAFIVLQCSKDWKPITLHFGRNDKNPLKMEKTEDSLYLSSEGVGELLTPGIIYTSSIKNPTIALTEKPFTMAEPVVAISTYTNWGGHSGHSTTLYRGMCIEQKCTQEKMKGTDKCAEHCEVKFLTGAYGTEGDSRKVCIYTNCLKKRREGIQYCKKHKNLAEATLPNPSCKIDYPEVDLTCSGCEHDPKSQNFVSCLAEGEALCSNCEHTKAQSTKYPAGFKTEAERNKLDTENTEIKTVKHEDCKNTWLNTSNQRVCLAHNKPLEENDTTSITDEEDYTTDDEYCMIDNIIHEYFEFLDADELPDPEDYVALLKSLMERSAQKTLARIEASDINPQECIASMGVKGIEAENFLIASEEYQFEEAERLEGQAQQHAGGAHVNPF